ncbi:MAG: PD40 domain-containing protein [Bacteroidales bacterium]|nr:PD40 domain-containing protein [Bacteroidales bacterium]
MRKAILLFVLMTPFLMSAVATAQGTMLLRQPTVSRTHVVFVHANDLWIAPRDGGDAVRLTSSAGQESSPHFSPDGESIAFTGQYDGNTDVYLVPTAGGQPVRLTWHPGADNVTGWTPDGKYVLFASGREGFPTAESKFYRISIAGGMPEPLAVPRASSGSMSEDGRFMAYQDISFWDPEWRNYRGGQAKPIWILNLKDYTLKKTPQTDRERHTDPVWLNGKVWFLSERDYANNVWCYDPSADDLKQITFHADFDVKSLDAGGGMIVYEQGGSLHLLNPADNKAKKLTINVRGDFHWARDRWETISASALQNASLSPTGQRALFEYRGEVFTVPKEKGSWRNITNSPGAADRYPVWSPDGKSIAWFSDQSGEYQLFVTDQEGAGKPRVISIPEPTFFFRPAWSPDSRRIAFTDTHYNLWIVEIATAKVTKADTERFAHPNRTMNPVWSPDSKWIAYARLLDNQFKAIRVYNVETAEMIQMTDGMADAFSPVWDASGKYLWFLASTNYGLNTGWLDMSSYERPATMSLYFIVLSKDDPSPLLPKSDEEKEKSEETKKEAGDVVVKIDRDNISRRIIAAGLPERSYQGLTEGPANTVFLAESATGQQGVTLLKYSLTSGKSEPFLTGANYATVSADRKTLLYRSGTTWGIVNTSESNKKPGDGRLETLSGLQMKISPTAEWKQIFREGWRFQRDFLYVDNVHGAPWNDIYKWYSPWIEHVHHRADLNYVIDILGGEVSVGHSYTSGGDFPSVPSVPIGLLGADYVADKGYHRISRIYTGEDWNPGLDAPLSRPGINVSEGDYILEVNGVAVKAEDNLYRLFEGTSGRQVKIRVNSEPRADGSRLVTVVPVSNEGQLRNFAWIERNRREVARLSDNLLAYVYVPNTSQQGYAYFNRYYFSQQDKKGAIIDERNNGGGSAADYMVDIMARKLHGYFNSKASDRRPTTTPMAGIWGPKVMIVNERAGSGGDLLPYLFRSMKIGTIVGTRTWGGLVGTWDTPPFVDGGRMVAPRGGFYDVNGQWAVEGEGVAPDIEVEMTPSLVIAGRDPQLEKAVEQALKQMKEEIVYLKPEPKAPVRYKRPVKK